MDNYQKLNKINETKQKTLDEIKNICQSLDKAEDALREKIQLRQTELLALNKDFNNIIETYNHIISSSINK